MSDRNVIWRSYILLLCAGLWLVVGCSTEEREPLQSSETEDASPSVSNHEGSGSDAEATARIVAKSGSRVSGEAAFVMTSAGDVQWSIELENAAPGRHAVHLHETGDCSAPDGSSAGGHWNPTNVDHGKWGQEPFHLGDIGNVHVGENEYGALERTSDRWTLGDGDHSILGKAIVVHAGPDDFTTQPDGAAGERVGCGVIERKSES